MAHFTTVFLSSTTKDLQPWRDAVAEKLAKSGFHCVRMEDFGARNASPEEASRQGVAESDVFVGLVGHLYGSCPEGSDLSFTRIEYEEAKRRRKPRLLFVAHEDFPVSPRLLREETPEISQRQLAFRETVLRERTIERFLETGNLAADVIAALHKLPARSSRKGTPRTGARKASSSLAKTESLYLAHLAERYRYLDFRGMGISDRVPLRLPLLDMYVPLKARVQTPEGETWARQMRLAGRLVGEEEAGAMGEKLSEPQPVLDLLQKNSGLVLLGDPGSGKTTFLKSLALALASGQEETPGLGRRLPVLVPLSAYANAIAKRDLPLQNFFARYFKERGLELPITSLLTEKLARGEVLLLLDGLDEVRDLKHRSLVVERVQDFYSRHRGAGNKFVLTSRVVGYREVRPSAEGLAEVTLVDFDDEEIQAFVEKWTAAIEKAATGETRTAQEDASREREELLAAVQVNPGVRSLAANPLLLTILALMKRQGVTLPERRVELYQRYVETLLKHWNLARGLAGRPAKDLDLMDTLRVLQPLALWMHETSPGVGLVKEGDLHRELQRIFTERKERDPEKVAHQFLADVRDHTSLLLDRGGRQYGFIHLTFQEYLAAAALAQRGQQEVEQIVAALSSHVGEAPWREVSLLTLGYLGLVQQRDQAAGAVLAELLRRSPGPAGEAAILAGEAVVDMGRGVIASECRERIVDTLLTVMRDDRQVKAPRRAAAGRALAGIGDPRPEVMSIDGMELCWVPAGPFLMGSKNERDAFRNEEPQFEYSLPYDFWVGRYPVTVAQYSEYAAETKKTEDPREPILQDNNPATALTWYETIGFCRWLTARWRRSGRMGAGWEVRLPSEVEWEKAARGGLVFPSKPVVQVVGGRVPNGLRDKVNPKPGRRFPWGSRAYGTQGNYGGWTDRPSAVGCFPGGASVYGVEELIGNVWEWTRSLWGENLGDTSFPYPYVKKDGREDLEAPASVFRVLRGGAFFDPLSFARCGCRGRNDPNIRAPYIGFRVVLSPFPL